MPRDLSLEHEPVTDLFELPSSPHRWEEFALCPEDVEKFEKDGFVAGISVLDEDQLEVLQNELSEIMDPAHPGNSLFYEFHSNESEDPDTVLFHALGAWRISPAFHDLLWNPAILKPAAQLLDGPVRFWHDQLFCKPPRQGGVVAWHQDYSYWTRTKPMAHLTCWIGLDDATEENGCLRYIPGSHRWDLLPITGLAGDPEAIEEVLRAEQKEVFKAVSIELKAGQCSFHHPLMVHGSHRNQSEKPRRGAVVNFIRDGVRSVQDEPLLQGVDPIPSGEPLGGRFFPLLYEPC